MGRVAMSLGAMSTAAIPAGVLVAQEEASVPGVVQMPAVTVQATPRYHHVAGSCEVPVYGTSVAVPILYQQSTAGLPTTEYLEPCGLLNHQGAFTTLWRLENSACRLFRQKPLRPP